MEVTEYITRDKTSIASDWNRHGPEITIKTTNGAIVTLCFQDEETMRLFGVAVGVLCSEPDKMGLIRLRNVNKFVEV